MTTGQTRRKLNAKAFITDFVRGGSDAELRQKYDLSHSQLTGVIGRLKKRGSLGEQEFAQRAANLNIRFGSPDGPPDPEAEGKTVVDVNTGLVLHCPSCAAPVRRGASHCDYCNAALDFSVDGKTIPCPHCFANTPMRGRFCIRCARPIKGLVREGKLLEDRLCPRCELPMRGNTIGEFSAMRCDRCSGFFVPNETFEMMQENYQRVVFPTGETTRAQVEAGSEIRYVRCPVCRNIMNRTNFARASGVVIDTCRKDGIWFDAEELERIMDFIARGGLQKARARDLQEAKAQKERMKIRNIPLGQSQADPVEAYFDLTDLVSVVRSLFRVLT